MKLPAFNHAEARWDRYKAFHNMHLPRYRRAPDSGIITLFDTGEMIVNNYGIYHTQRRHYPEWNISILSPRDGRWPKVKAPDGTIVRSMSMLTVNADQHPLMKNFHRPEDEKRMVVILNEDDFDAWLDPGLRAPELMLRCLEAEALSL